METDESIFFISQTRLFISKYLMTSEFITALGRCKRYFSSDGSRAFAFSVNFPSK